MTNQKADTDNYLGPFLLMVLSLLFVFAFSGNSTTRPSGSSQHELTSGDYSKKADAVIADAIQLTFFQQSCVQAFIKKNFSMFDEHLKINVDNRRIAHNIIWVQENGLSITPLPTWRFYYHLSPADSEDLPDLS